jgi:hypothetical protein
MLAILDRVWIQPPDSGDPYPVFLCTIKSRVESREGAINITGCFET